MEVKDNYPIGYKEDHLEVIGHTKGENGRSMLILQCDCGQVSHRFPCDFKKPKSNPKACNKPGCTYMFNRNITKKKRTRAPSDLAGQVLSMRW